VNHARRDLCGGCSAMGIPTAIGLPKSAIIVGFCACESPTYAHHRSHFCGDPRSCQTWQSWEPYRNFDPSNLSVVLVKIVVRILSLSDFENSRWSEHPLKGQP
jgi:hypothetical protein